MIKPNQIPPEVVEALRAHLNTCECDDCTAETIAATLNTWPRLESTELCGHLSGPAIILPLPQKESSND